MSDAPASLPQVLSGSRRYCTAGYVIVAGGCGAFFRGVAGLKVFAAVRCCRRESSVCRLRTILVAHVRDRTAAEC